MEIRQNNQVSHGPKPVTYCKKKRYQAGNERKQITETFSEIRENMHRAKVGLPPRLFDKGKQLTFFSSLHESQFCKFNQ